MTIYGYEEVEVFTGLQYDGMTVIYSNDEECLVFLDEWMEKFNSSNLEYWMEKFLTEWATKPKEEIVSVIRWLDGSFQEIEDFYRETEKTGGEEPEEWLYVHRNPGEGRDACFDLIADELGILNCQIRPRKEGL